jgi:hypothetical protein
MTSGMLFSRSRAFQRIDGRALRTGLAGCVATVITFVYHDNMIRTQISFDENLYKRARAVARRMGISLAELCRRSLEEVVAREPSDKPWMGFAGIHDGDESDSSSVDQVVYGRESP